MDAEAEQQWQIDRIAKAKNHYQVLNLVFTESAAFSNEEFDRQYKQLARQLHPDKCSLNGAEEAFKSIKLAVDTLKANNAQTTFKLLDANHDGGISLDELSQGLSDCGLTDEDIEQLMFKLDVNHDGTVTEEEFEAGFDSIFQENVGVNKLSGSGNLWVPKLPSGAFEDLW